MNGGKTVLATVSALVVILMVAPASQAAESAFSFQSGLPVTVDGQYQASGLDASAIVQGADGDVTFLLEGGSGTLERVLHRATGYIKADEPQAGVLWRQTVETVEMPLDDTYVTLDQRMPTFTLLAYDGPVALRSPIQGGQMHATALAHDQVVRSQAEAPIQFNIGKTEAKPFEHFLDAGDHQARAMDSRIEADGAFSLYIGDAVLDLHGPDGLQTLRAHFRTEEKAGGVYDPVSEKWTGPGTHTEYVHEYVVLHIAEGRLQVQNMGTPAFLVSEAPQIHIDGETVFPAATGTVTVWEDDAEATHRIDGQDLALGGRYTFALAPIDDTSSDVHGEGDITQVRYDALTHEYDWATIAAATGIGAILLAAIAWLTSSGKSLVAGLGGFLGIGGYARVQGEEILQHEGRRTVYETVKEEPGLHFVDLGKRLDFGASTLNYHLRVLERNGYVNRVKDGRYVRFFDAKSGEYSRDRKQAASTLRNATTAAIAGFILSNPGIVQRDLAQHFGIAASTVSWHVDRLRKDGLVEKQRDQHFTRYYMGDAWSTLPDAELQRVGQMAVA